MAIVYSYPTTPESDLSGSDLLILSKMDENGRPTKSVTLSSLATYIASGAATGGPYLPLTAGPTVPLTGDLYMAPNGAGPSVGSKNIVFRGIDDLGNELDGGRIFTVDSTINPSGQDLYFQNANDNGILATNLMVDAFGSVGIGTTSPSYTLDVNGSGNFATTLNVGGNVQFGGTTDFRYFQASNSIGLGTSSPNFKFDISGGDLRFENNDGVRFGGTGSNNTNWYIYTTGTNTGTFEIGNPTKIPSLSIYKSGLGTPSVQGKVQFNFYGSGNFVGTAAYNLQTDASGNIIETAATVGGADGNISTISYTRGLSNAYRIRLYVENITPGSPDFGQAFAQPQLIAFTRQNAPAGTQGGMPFNLFYNQWTPALDPSYDAGMGCGSANTCLRALMEESVADINLLNSGNTQLGNGFTIMSQDAASLNSYRMPLRMRIDNGGASPGNGTLRFTLIDGNNNAPNTPDDAIALPSTVSVYFRDTTLTTSTMGRPPFNLIWAGADTAFAQIQNGGVAYTNSLDYVFTGNAAGDINRKYELFFQDEVNAYNRCSYLKVTDGRVVFQDLPTADPVSKGVLWNDAGTLKVSLG